MRSIIQKTKDGIELNLLELLRTWLHFSWLIIFVGIVFGLAATVSTCYFTVPEYTASISLYVNNTKVTSTGISTGDLNASVMVAKTYNALIGSTRVLSAVLEEAGITDISPDALSSRISAKSVDETEYVWVSIRDTDPVRAAQLANAFAAAAPEVLEDIVDGSTIRIVDTARVPTSPSSPNVKTSILSGVLVGLMLGIFGVSLWAILDTRIKSEEDLQQWDYPLLGVIPDFEAAKSEKNAYEYH